MDESKKSNRENTSLTKNCEMKDKLLNSSNRIFKSLPYFVSGEVVTGFGRGSKQLGIPTGMVE